MIDILLNCLPNANKKSFTSKSYQLLDFPWFTSSLPLHVSVCLYLKYVSNLLNLQNQKKRKI